MISVKNISIKVVTVCTFGDITQFNDTFTQLSNQGVVMAERLSLGSEIPGSKLARSNLFFS